MSNLIKNNERKCIDYDKEDYFLKCLNYYLDLIEIVNKYIDIKESHIIDWLSYLKNSFSLIYNFFIDSKVYLLKYMDLFSFLLKNCYFLILNFTSKLLHQKHLMQQFSDILSNFFSFFHILDKDIVSQITSIIIIIKIKIFKVKYFKS